MTKMGPAVLPLSEKLLFALNWMVRRLPGGRGIKPYIPDFRRAFDHFCLHAGGHLPSIALLAHRSCWFARSDRVYSGDACDTAVPSNAPFLCCHCSC